MLNELSPIRKIPAGRRRAMLNKRQRSLPQQLEGFVEKRLTDPRRQCETLLRTYLSKMDQVVYICQDSTLKTRGVFQNLNQLHFKVQFCWTNVLQ